jgi:hypothetical protein
MCQLLLVISRWLTCHKMLTKCVSVTRRKPFPVSSLNALHWINCVVPDSRQIGIPAGGCCLPSYKTVWVTSDANCHLKWRHCIYLNTIFLPLTIQLFVLKNLFISLTASSTDLKSELAAPVKNLECSEVFTALLKNAAFWRMTSRWLLFLCYAACCVIWIDKRYYRAVESNSLFVSKSYITLQQHVSTLTRHHQANSLKM